MGVQGLDSFTRQQVPNGCFPISIKNEIVNYAGTPTIVIYTPSLLEPLNKPDMAGVLCGGRYELVYQLVDRFLSELVKLGARLVFFSNGPCRKATDKVSRERRAKHQYDWKLITEMVDNGIELFTLKGRRHVPHNDQYPVDLLAKRYGQFRVPSEGDCKKEMVSYAKLLDALAIVSNNSDFLIFDGPWRFWSATNLNFMKLTTVELNRPALRAQLGLEGIEQLALLATLASSNNFLTKEESKPVLALHSNGAAGRLGSLAEFVRRSHDDVLLEIFGPAANEGDLRERFQRGLDYYGKDGLLSAGIDMNFYKELDIYKMWLGLTVEIIDIGVDLWDNGPSYLDLSVKILLRIASIVAYHRQPKRVDQDFRILKKHEADFHEENHAMTFPQHQFVPPTLEEMFSRDSDIGAILADTKLQLYCWIISDSLDHHQLGQIPPKLAPTVATIYLLREAQLIELFEADLLLQVAYEIAFHKYDMFQLQYPQWLNSRAFRVARFYAAICLHTAKALAAVGLDTREYPGYPLFDGVLFQNLYSMWAQGKGETMAIVQWRIYKDV